MTVSDLCARKLGYNLIELPPGEAQRPFYCHHGELEMFFILKGEGERADGGNISAAAKLLGISRPTLYDLLKQYGMQGRAAAVPRSLPSFPRTRGSRFLYQVQKKKRDSRVRE